MKLLPLASTTWSHEEIEVATQVLNSGQLTMGSKVRDFEEQFSSHIGTKYAVMFNSGSSANLAMLMAIKLHKSLKSKSRPNVLVPAVSWSTTFYPVNQAGFELKFVDVDSGTLNMDVHKAIEAIDENTVGIFTVNLLGNPAGLLDLKKVADDFGLFLLEDNCEALGARVDGKFSGSVGLGGSHSFFFSHHICTMEGGMVTTDDLAFYELMVSIRAHGWTRELPVNNTIYPKTGSSWDDLFRFVIPGFNLRPLEISAAIGTVQLGKLSSFVAQRRENARIFVNLFQDSEFFDIQQEEGESSWFGFSLILKNECNFSRTQVIEELTRMGVDTRPIVAGNFARNPVMNHLVYSPLPPLHIADRVHDRGFFFGNHHYDISQELMTIHENLNKVMRLQ